MSFQIHALPAKQFTTLVPPDLLLQYLGALHLAV